VLEEHKFAKETLNGDDAEMRELAKMEMPGLETEKDSLEKELTKLLIPKDPQDDKNAIIELRAGTGGDEASLFVGDLLTMYTRYCQKKGWKVALVSESEGSVGGYKEVILEVVGEDVYGTMKFESGVHRVQRVPSTETQGRVHTSAATVAVMPEAEEVDFVLNPADVKMETSRSGSRLCAESGRCKNGNFSKRWCGWTERKQGRDESNVNAYSNGYGYYLSNRAFTVR